MLSFSLYDERIMRRQHIHLDVCKLVFNGSTTHVIFACLLTSTPNVSLGTLLNLTPNIAVGSNAEVAAGHDLATGVAFIENSASGLGGAMFFEDADLLQVNLATFKSNEAVLGGAAYIVAVEDKTTEFSACNFDGNEANDGGAIYFNTGSGVDIITASYFRGNTARTPPRFSLTSLLMLSHTVVLAFKRKTVKRR